MIYGGIMEKQILDLFNYINDTTENREHKIIKLKLLIHIALKRINKVDLFDNSSDYTILKKFSNSLYYLYSNFDAMYKINEKYEKDFKKEDDNLSTYVDRIEMDEDEVKFLKFIVNLIGISFFDNRELEIENCPGAKNQAMLRLNKVYKK